MGEKIKSEQNNQSMATPRKDANNIQNNAPTTPRIRNRTSTKLHIAARDIDHKQQQPVSVVVQLSGELGNQLQKLGNGFCIQHLSKQN